MGAGSIDNLRRLTGGALRRATARERPTAAVLIPHGGIGFDSASGSAALVALEDDGLSVAVREGRIALQPPKTGSPPSTAAAGERLRIARDAPGRIERTMLPPDDAQWDWIESVPAPLEVEGASLGEFVGWYRRETGQAVMLDGVDAATRLHGSIAGMTPDEALDAIALATDLDVRREQGRIIVRAR